MYRNLYINEEMCNNEIINNIDDTSQLTGN